MVGFEIPTTGGGDFPKRLRGGNAKVRIDGSLSVGGGAEGGGGGGGGEGGIY